MPFFPAHPHYIGIETTPTSIKIAALQQARKGWKVAHLKELSLNESVKQIDSFTKEGVVISALPSRNVLVRSCEIPLKKKKDILAALDFQVEPLLPYPSENAIIQTEIGEQKENKTALTIFAAKKEHIEAHLDSCAQHGMEPERITSIPSALAAFSTLLPQKMSTILIIHVGEAEVTSAFVERGNLLAAYAFDRKLNLEIEIKKTILSFSASCPTKEVEAVLLVGDKQSAQTAVQKASDNLLASPVVPSLFLSEEEIARFALPIGMALSANGPDFRQKDFVYPHRWKRLKKPLITFFLCASLFACSLFGCGHLYLKNYQNTIQHKYLFFKKNSIPQNPAAYLQALDEIENEIQAQPNIYPLHPQVPKVGETLAWLHTLAGPVEIDSVHYTIEARPSVSHPKERYKVRVELEFRADDTNKARAFHDRLTSANPFVNSREDIQWHTTKGKYRAVFYLKDKTHYT